MRWKPFFTPVASLDASQARTFVQHRPAGGYLLLDVRQPGEYQAGHLPGAKLIPLADLGRRLEELDPRVPTLVYCAIGGRSRVAAQMLAGKGFKAVYNLSGGIKAWNGGTAAGGEEQGLALFSGNESPIETLVTAYALEAGLRDFYLALADRVGHPETGELFRKLSSIEVKHQERLLQEYTRLAGTAVGREVFETQSVLPQVEGGLTTEEYLALYQPDLSELSEVVSLAMAIEAQALDLYQRAAARAETPQAGEVLQRIADEELAHLAQLSTLMDSLADP